MHQATMGVLKSFSHPAISLHSLSYVVFFDDVADMSRVLPKEEYILLIANIPYGFRLAGSINDEDPYKYSELQRMKKEFANLITTPLR